MRKLLLISPKNSHQLIVTHNLISSIQKLRFSACSNGENIKHHNQIHLLHDPSKITSLKEAKSLHALVITMGSFPTQEPVFLLNNLIAKYSSLGDIFAARKVFDEMPQRNAVTYNTIVNSYSRGGFLQEALGLFSQMRTCGFMPTQFTFGSLLSCHCLDVFEGMQLQALIEKTGLLYVDAFAGTALLGFYGRHGCLDEALEIFEHIPKKNLVTWNSMISVFGQMGYVKDCVFMFSELRMKSVGISEFTFVAVLSCLEGIDMQLGEQIHGLVIKYGFDNVASVYNCLINMYVKSSAICLAEKMFEVAPVKDIVTWNTIIGAMANSDRPTKALDTFLRMCMTGLSPKVTTLANALQTCSRLQLLSYGECIHAKMIKKSFESDVYAGSALVDLYAKCDKVEEARTCFDGITQKNSVSWNSLMLAYSNRGSSFSVRLLQEMIHSGYDPNELSFSIVIKSSPETELQQLHSLTIKMGYHENSYVSSSLISSYARNGLVSNALNFVESKPSDNAKLPVVSSNVIAWIYNQTGQYGKTQELYAAVENPDTISWNILIAACSRNGDYTETFELFNHMRRSQVYPDNYTFVSLFSVCTKLCNLVLGSSLHGLIIKTDFSLCDTFVRNIMIDMYGKCGGIDSSVKIFDSMKETNIYSWTALVSALGTHGYANEAIERFREMERAGVEPDKVSFQAVLSACRHVGLVNEGMDLFNEMKVKYGVKPDIDHYLVVVDLLTRYGRIKEAEQLILGMPFAPNALIWRSFLEGCKRQSTMAGLALAA